MLKLVIRAPSAINLQPWEFYVVMGEEKARLSRRLVKLYREKQISCSPGNVKPLSAEFNKRGAESFILMNPYLEKMGMDFNCFVNEGSCNFYGAPTAVIMCLDNAFSEARLVDIGIALGIFCSYSAQFRSFDMPHRSHQCIRGRYKRDTEHPRQQGCRDRARPRLSG